MLKAGNHHTQPGGIWFGPLPAPTPTLCLGRAERLLVPVSISELVQARGWGGVGWGVLLRKRGGRGIGESQGLSWQFPEKN